MRPKSILREGLRGVVARPFNLLVATFLMAVLFGGTGVADAFTTAASVSDIQDEIDKGANVLLVDRNSGSLDAETCLRMEDIQGVTAVGAVSDIEISSIEGYPSVPFQRASITPGLIPILYPGLSIETSSTGLAAEQVQDEVGVVDGATLTFTDGMEVVLTVPAQGTARSDDRARWIYTFGSASAQVVECWVEAAPGSVAPVREVIASQFEDAPDMRIRTLTPTAPYESATRSWLARTTQYAWIVGAVLGGGVIVLLLSQRRHEFALYRLVGVSLGKTALIATVEAQALLLASGVIAFEVSYLACQIIAGGDPLVVRVSSSQVASGLCGAYFLAVIGAVICSSGNTTRMIRNRV